MILRSGYLSFVVGGGCAAGAGYVQASGLFPGQVGGVSNAIALIRLLTIAAVVF